MEDKYIYIINPFFPGNPEGVDFRTMLKTHNSIEEACIDLYDYLTSVFQDVDMSHIYKNCEDISTVSAILNGVKFKILVHFYEVY